MCGYISFPSPKSPSIAINGGQGMEEESCQQENKRYPDRLGNGNQKEPIPFFWVESRKQQDPIISLRNKKELWAELDSWIRGSPHSSHAPPAWGWVKQNNLMCVQKEPKGSKKPWTLPLGRHKGHFIPSRAEETETWRKCAIKKEHHSYVYGSTPEVYTRQRTSQQMSMQIHKG